MNKKSFKASQWFLTTQAEKKILKKDDIQMSDTVASALAPFVVNNKSSSTISDYFIPSFEGDHNSPKEIEGLNRLIDEIHTDVFSQFVNLKRFTPKLRKGIFEEFLFFAEHLAIESNSITDVHSFWEELSSNSSPNKEIINQFINIYTFRTAIIYILKVRFISILIDQTETKFNLKSILYPSSFITSFFQQGSSSQLDSKALQQNIFSWYKPSASIEGELSDVNELFLNLDITEILKNISQRSEKILSTDTVYSHSISHKNFGLFMNSILINFPLWLNTHKGSSNSNVNYKTQGMEVLSTKFSGDYLESMALSHWLAQESNKHIKWEQIICPDFKRHNFATGNYLKIINELQFLTFLAEIANKQGHNPIKFVSRVSKAHLSNRKDNDEQQKSLLLNEIIVKKSTYDRIVLNVSNFPKNNSSHYLINKINQQLDYIKENGLLYIISSKKLFIPSQKAKLNQLLEKIDLQALLNFSEVKGKGELGSYIYIFTKKKDSLLQVNEKKSCLHFRFSTELESFHHFSHIIKLSQDFFLSNLGEKPALYQKEFDNVRLEFYQDAIVDGRLLHSSSSDSSKITHPHFFQNLMNSCKSLDTYFDIRPVRINETEDFSLLSDMSIADEDYQNLIIVDQRKKNETKIEVVKKQDFEKVYNEYGHFSCHFFYLFPKKSNISEKLINDFYSSSIGKQIIDLIFNNQSIKIKSNLEKLLFPSALTGYKPMPDSIRSGLSLLEMDSSSIIELHPTKITELFRNIDLLSEQILKSYPSNYISLLSHFGETLQVVQEILGSKNKKVSINFNNPIIKTPLLLTPTRAIYPQNDDIFIEFESDNSMSLIHSQFTKAKRFSSVTDDVENFRLDIYSDQIKVLSLFSDEDMITFLEFILKGINGVTIADILQNINVPSLESLKSILASYNLISATINEISGEIPKRLNKLMITLVSQV